MEPRDKWGKKGENCGLKEFGHGELGEVVTWQQILLRHTSAKEKGPMYELVYGSDRGKSQEQQGPRT